MTEPVVAVDLGGTTMRAAIVGPDGQILERCEAPTPDDPTPRALLELIQEVLEGDSVRVAVVGVPGRVNYVDGRLEHAPNLPSAWASELTETAIAEQVGVPVHLANDADLAAVGEAFFGAGREYDDVAYVTISTGVGAGVLLRRRLVRGRRSLAEIGHTMIDLRASENEPRTVEDLGSGTALERSADAVGLPDDGERIVELVKEGDPKARKVWNAMVAAIQLGVTNLAWTFTPEVVVLGGGVGLNGDLLIDPLEQHLREHGPRALPEPILVRVAELGDDAALTGAAAWEDATAHATGGTEAS